MKNRLISLWIVFALFIGMTNSAVFAKTTEDFSEQSSLLIKIGAFSADGDMEENAKIKRERFAKDFTLFINKAENVDKTKKQDKSYYYDVALDNEYIAYINYLTESGFVSGDENGNFRPDDYITNQEMLKCVVSALGYTAQASLAAYPDGYLSVASGLGLTKKVGSLNDDATIGSMIRLFYTALDANVMEASLNEAGKFEVNKNVTYLNKTFEIYKTKGMIDGNYLTNLSGASGTMKEDTITINGEKFLLSEENFYLADLIGFNVEIYYRENGVENEIVAAADNKTDELVISAGNIEMYENGKIYYTIEEKTKKASIDKNAVIMYNGAVVTSYTEDIFTDIQNGSLELLKSENDSDYSIVKVYNYHSYFVKSISEESNKIFAFPQRTPNPEYDATDPIKSQKDEYLYNYPVIELDNYKHYFIRNSFGLNMKLAELSKNNIISVGESLDGTICYINAGLTLATGTIDSMYTNSNKDNCIKISGEEYVLDNDFDRNIDFKPAINMNVIAYISYNGKIAGMEIGTASGEWAYAYMMNLISDEVTDDYIIKMYTTADRVEKYNLKDKVRLDGLSTKKEDVLKYFQVIPGAGNTLSVEPQLIRYKMNGDYVSAIDTKTINVSGGESQETSLSLDKEYGRYRFHWSTKQFCAEGSFRYNDYDTSLRAGNNTYTFYVPDPTSAEIGYERARSDESLYSVKQGSSVFKDTQSYYFEAYNINYDNGALADVIVSRAGESETYEGNLVIQEVEHTIDQDDMPCVKIKGYYNGSASLTSYTLENNVTDFEDIANLSESGSQPNLATWRTDIDDSMYGLSVGDVIGIKTVMGKISKIRRYFSPTFVCRRAISEGRSFDIIRSHGIIQADNTYMGTLGAADTNLMVGVITGYNNGYISFYNVDPAISRGEKALDSRGAIPKRGKLTAAVSSGKIYKYNTKKNRLEQIDESELNEYLYGVNSKAYAYMYTRVMVLQSIVIYE